MPIDSCPCPRKCLHIANSPKCLHFATSCQQANTSLEFGHQQKGRKMELNEIVEEAKKKTGLSQNRLAERIGLSRSSLSQVLHGKRPLPAEAAIELFDLTGIHPRKILQATVKKAASVALALCISFVQTPKEAQAKSNTYEHQIQQNTDYAALKRRKRKRSITRKAALVRNTVKAALQHFCSRGTPRPA